MKKTFTVITVLISISLIGIILIQLSWLRNMILLTQEQIKSKVDKAILSVGDDLMEYKSNYSLNMRRIDSEALVPDDFPLNFCSHKLWVNDSVRLSCNKRSGWLFMQQVWRMYSLSLP